MMSVCPSVVHIWLTSVSKFWNLLCNSAIPSIAVSCCKDFCYFFAGNFVKFIITKLNEKLQKEQILRGQGEGSHVEGNNSDSHPDSKDPLGDSFSHEELSLLIVKNKNLEDTPFCDLGKRSYYMFFIEELTQLPLLYTGKISPPFIFALFALWPEGEIKTGLIERYINEYAIKLERVQIQECVNRF